MLFLLNLLTSNVIYHNICILSTLILKNLMYLKSIDELPTPLFRSLHSSLIIAFHYLPSPFIAFYRRPISLSAHSLLSPVLSSPRPALSPCPRIPPLHTCFPPASSPPLFHTSVFHAPLSAPLCFTPFVLLTPLFYVLCFISSPFALLSPIVYPLRFIYSLPLRFIYSHCFAPVFLLPGNLRKPVPDTAKGNVFLIFQRNFAKSP